ncbi:MAG: hypothetical protein LBE32_00530 [Burkholderiales bacterium]|jgi:hypothetical protein|nr:hypothetical protein [Burkholderiales bacterium]
MSSDREFKLKITADGRVLIEQVGKTRTSVKGFTDAVQRDGAAASKSIDKLGGAFVSLAAKIGAAIGTFATLKKGISFNSQIEDARIGMAAMISAQNELRDGSGKLLQGQQAFNAALSISNDQLKKLQLEGVQTTATFGELVGVFKGILAPAQAIGLSIDDARKVTVQMTQVANALAIPMGMVENEVRAILTGTMRQEHQMHRALGITKEMVDEWAKAGTVMAELEKRTKMFAIAGQMASKSWSGMVAGLQETVAQFAGEITKTMLDNIKSAGNQVFDTFFDLDTMKINEKLLPLIAALNAALGGVGSVIGNAMTGLVDGAIRLSEWIGNNKEALSGIATQIGNIWDTFVKIIGVIADIIGKVMSWAVASSAVETALKMIAGVLVTVDTLIGFATESTVNFGIAVAAASAAWILIPKAILAVNAAIAACALAIRAYLTGAIVGVAMQFTLLSAAAQTTLAGIGKGFGFLAAAMIGWQIGKYLREEFFEVRVQGIRLTEGLLAGWEWLKFGVLAIWAFLRSGFDAWINDFRMKFSSMLEIIASGIAKIPKMGDVAAGLETFAKNQIDAIKGTETFEQALARLREERDRNLKTNREIFHQMEVDEILNKKQKESTDKTTESVKALDEWFKNLQATLKKTGQTASEEATKVADDWKKALENLHKQITLRDVDDNGLTGEYHKTMALAADLLSGKYKELKISLEQYLAVEEEAFGKTQAGIKLLAEKKRAIEEAAQANRDARKELHEMEAAIWSERDALNERLKTLHENNKLLGLSKTAVEKLKLSEMQLRLEKLKLTAATEGFSDALKDEIEALKQSVDLQRQVIDATYYGEAKEQQLKDIEETQRKAEDAAKSIRQSLTDAIMRGFESGKSFAQNFKDAVSNIFKTMVLRPIVEFTVQGGMNLLGIGGGGGGAGLLGGILSLFTGGGGGGGTGGGGGGAGILGNIFSLFGGGGGGGAGNLGLLQQGSGLLGLAANWLGFGSGAGFGTLAYANTIGALGGDAMGAFISANGGWGGTLGLGSGSGMGGMGALGAGLGYAGMGVGIGALINRLGIGHNQTGAMVGGGLGGLAGGFLAGGMGAGVAAGASGAAAGAAAGSVVPVVGTIIGAIIGGILGSVIGRKGGDKSGGFAASDGLEVDRYFTPSNRDDKAQEALAKIEKGWKQLGAGFGFNNANVGFGFGFDTDPKGDAGSRTAGGVYIDGEAIYFNREDWGRNADKFSEGMELEIQRMYLAAARELATGDLKQIFGDFDIAEAAKEEIEAAFNDASFWQFSVAPFKAAIAAKFGEAFSAQNIIDLKLEGETLEQTMARLISVFGATATAARLVGQNVNDIFGAGLASADDREIFAARFGGVDVMNEMLSYYAQHFRPDDITGWALEDSGEAIGAIFNDLNMVMPRTRAEFDQIVRGLDLTTDAGQRLFTQLMQVAPAFNSFVGALEDMSKSMDSTINGLRRSFELDGLSNPEKYNRLKKEADEAYVEFQNATDPKEIQRLFDLITTNMGQAWSLLSDGEKNARRAEYLNRLDALQESKDDRIGALIDQYTGVDAARDNIADAGNELADAIRDVADQIITGPLTQPLQEIITGPLTQPLQEIITGPLTQPLQEIITGPLTKPLQEILNAMSVLKETYSELDVNTKPLLLDDDPDAAFIAAHQLIQEAAQQQASSGESFGESVSTSAADFVQAVQSASTMQQQAGSHSAAAMSAAAGSLYALAASLQEQAAASQQQTQKIRASELN